MPVRITENVESHRQSKLTLGRTLKWIIDMNRISIDKCTTDCATHNHKNIEKNVLNFAWDI